MKFHVLIIHIHVIFVPIEFRQKGITTKAFGTLFLHRVDFSNVSKKINIKLN